MNEEEIREKARQLRAAGASIEQVKQYLASKGFDAGAPADTEEEPGVGTKILGTAASLLRGSPLEPVQAGARALFRGQSYREALSDLRGAEDAAPAPARMGAQLVGNGVMAMAVPGSAVRAGAAYGAASGLLDADPDATLEERLWQGGEGGVAGGVLGGVASGVSKFAKSPPGTTRNVLGKAFPRFKRAAEAWSEATAGPPPTVRPKVRLNEASAPKVSGLMKPEATVASEPVTLSPRNVQSLEERLAQMAEPVEKPNTLEGFLGNSVDNLEHAGSQGGTVPPRTDPLIQQLEEIIEQGGTKPKTAHAPRHATKARFNWFAEQMARKNAAPAADVPIEEASLEDLLAMNLEHVKKGGSMKSASDALRLVRQK